MSSPEGNLDHVEHTRKCCSFRYRIRWFNSKGAALVLLWIILISASVLILLYVIQDLILPFGLNRQKKFVWIYIVVLCVSCLVCAPLVGWLADARLGNYKVFKTGCMFLFIASVMACLHVLVFTNVPDNNNHFLPVISAAIVLVVSFFGIAGSLACFITSLQLGLDQMPDASTANITSFISWFVCCIFAGLWVGDASPHLFRYCLDTVSSSGIYTTSFEQIFSLFPVLCMAIVLCSDFLLSQKWLIIEPKSLQSLKIIYQVLKFAAKHKAPVNRSALTYWEEDIPSRIDLGKSKYGGPFTTEQVEDVKTILKLLVVSVPFSMISFIKFLSVIQEYGRTYVFPGISRFNSVILSCFTYHVCWCVVIGTLVHEFFIYPFARNKLPSILKRIGAVSFVTIVLHLVSLVLSVLRQYHCLVNTEVWHQVVLQAMSGPLMFVLFSAVFEFVCAQSPYNMRAIVTGYATLSSIYSPLLFGCLLVFGYRRVVASLYYSIIFNSITVLLAVIGFLLHCILARWYKRRVRDDIYSPHRLVEEVYDRYLSART